MYTNNVKKVAAVHDLSGVGHTSLMVVIPILSTMGFQVFPLPTVLLSGHTQFLDLTGEMPRIVERWKRMEFDSIYTGYLGLPAQVAIVEGFIDHFGREDNLVVVDPVLGDNGKLCLLIMVATSFCQVCIRTIPLLCKGSIRRFGSKEHIHCRPLCLHPSTIRGAILRQCRSPSAIVWR